MADEQSTDTADAVDTSTNEETQDTDDAELEDIEVSEEEIASDETEESSEAEEAATDSDKPEESKEDGDEESEEEGTISEDEQRRRNDEFAQKRIADREAREKAKLDEQDKYLAEAEDNRDLALRQLQIDAYNNKIEGNSNKLQNGIDKAVVGIELFRSGSLEAKEELANSLDDFERMYVTRDRNGDPIEVKGDVYQYLQAKADSIRRLTGVGARQQSKDKTKTSARTVTTPSRTPKEGKKDPDVEAFDEEAERP
jgi:hypothetical protein